MVDLPTDRRKGTGEIMGERGFNRVVMETGMPQWRRMMTRVAYEYSEQWNGYHHNLNDGDDRMPWWWGSWTCNGCPNLDFSRYSSCEPGRENTGLPLVNYQRPKSSKFRRCRVNE